MPYTFEILEELGLVLARATGPVQREDIVAFRAELKGHSDFRSDMDHLVDFREAKVGTSTGEVRALAQTPFVSESSRRAVLVGDDFNFGTMRMWSSRAGPHLGDMRPFRSLEEACEWLSIPTSVALDFFAKEREQRDAS